METISRLVQGLPRLRVHDDTLKTYEKSNPYQNKYPITDRSTYLGIEVEVENVQQWARVSPYWEIKEDGSLRNNGKEFVTPPIRAYRVEQALSVLFEKELNQDVDFSERTSIHVHMNVRTLTVNQLNSFLLIYLLFEKALFNYVGNSRDQNIFCNPLYTTLEARKLNVYKNDIRLLARNWNKYTALNLAPIAQLGTVEFRHLHGTNSIKKIISWINIILCIKMYALKTPTDQVEMRTSNINTSSEYNALCQEVFGSYAGDLSNYPKFVEDCYYCSSYIKEFYYLSDFKLELTNTTSGAIGKIKSPYFTETLGTLDAETNRVRIRQVFNQIRPLATFRLDEDEPEEVHDEEPEEEESW